MILSDREISAAIELGHITIEPRPDPEMWTSTAIDLTLDRILLLWKTRPKKSTGGQGGPESVFPTSRDFSVQKMTEDVSLAEKIELPDIADQACGPEGGHPLGPREFVLGYTRQVIYLPNQSRIAARVEGKSSLARLGVGIHVTAPTIHAGFGYNKEKPGLPIQLEIFNLGNFIVHLKAGMPICQLIFEEVREVPNKGYQGQFSAQAPFKSDQ